VENGKSTAGRAENKPTVNANKTTGPSP